MILANIFQPLIDIFGPVLVFLHTIIGGSWGWSIIALTVLVRALLLPLAFKQMHSMHKLQRVAPQMKAIQARYQDDKPRQQQEIVKFYRDNDLHPFASLLPLVAQIPVFIGLYYTLRTRLRDDICPGLQAAFRHAYAAHHHTPLHQAAGHTVACHGLNGSSWLFSDDLTNTATGLTLVVLIVLYVGTQLASSLMMQAPTTDQTQRRMMLLLPLLFVIRDRQARSGRTVGVDAAPEFMPKRNSELIVTAAGSPRPRRVSRLANLRCARSPRSAPASLRARYSGCGADELSGPLQVSC